MLSHHSDGVSGIPGQQQSSCQANHSGTRYGSDLHCDVITSLLRLFTRGLLHSCLPYLDLYRLEAFKMDVVVESKEPCAVNQEKIKEGGDDSDRPWFDFGQEQRQQLPH
jgi:hypothetical protein